MCAAACSAYSPISPPLTELSQEASTRNIAAELSDITQRTNLAGSQVFRVLRVGSTEIAIKGIPTIVGVDALQPITSSLLVKEGRYYNQWRAHDAIMFTLSEERPDEPIIASCEIWAYDLSPTAVRWDADPESINPTFIANDGAVVDKKTYLKNLRYDAEAGADRTEVVEKLAQLAVEIFNRSDSTMLVNDCIVDNNDIDWRALGFVFNRNRSQAALVKSIATMPPPPFDTQISTSRGITSYSALIERSPMIEGSGAVIPAELPMALVEISMDQEGFVPIESVT